LYQGKLDDKIVTPANLLVLPLEDTKMLNLQDYSTVGSDLLKGQESFKKVREFHKGTGVELFSTTTNPEVVKMKLNQHFFTSSSFLTSVNYGLIRQKNLFSDTFNNNFFIDETPSSQLLNNYEQNRD